MAGLPIPRYKQPILGAEDLSQHMLDVPGYPGEQLSFVIGIDGRAGAGKSGLVAWLSWQLGKPVVSLELYLIRHTKALEWRHEDLVRVMRGRLETGRPLIVEDIGLCQVLQAIDHDPDFLVWLDNEDGSEHGPEEPTQDYERAFNPAGNADYVLTWREAELVVASKG